METAVIELISYNRESYDKFVDSDIHQTLSRLRADRVNWINMDGQLPASVVEKMQQHFNLHTLVVEDILTDQRPKEEEFEEYLFFTMKMLNRIADDSAEFEQISFVLGENFLLSFQEKAGDPFDAFRERIRQDLGRVRKKGSDYLLYRLMDIIVDNYYNVLDHVGEQIEETEASLRTTSPQESFARIQRLKKQLIYLQRALHPLRDAIRNLLKDESRFIKDENEKYYADLHENIKDLIDSLDTYRELTSSLMDIYVNTQNSRLNDVIRVLTIISTIFIPLTFIVGVYGMNFRHFPELEWRYGYLTVWIVMLAIALAMITFFRRRRWL